MRKLERELGRLAEEFGWPRPVLTNGNHYAFEHPSTGRKIFFSSTPGDRRAIQKLKQKFRIANRGD